MPSGIASNIKSIYENVVSIVLGKKSSKENLTSEKIKL